jgi:hypothetical protein
MPRALSGRIGRATQIARNGYLDLKCSSMPVRAPRNRHATAPLVAAARLLRDRAERNWSELSVARSLFSLANLSNTRKGYPLD